MTQKKTMPDGPLIFVCSNRFLLILAHNVYYQILQTLVQLPAKLIHTESLTIETQTFYD